jgi:hypothetical protein
MADSNFRGPVNAMGSLENANATTSPGSQVPIDPLDGPSSFYQGICWPDPRSVPFPKDGFRPGQLPAILYLGDMWTVDAIPQATSSTTLAAAQAVTANVAMALSTVAVTNFSSGAASVAYGVPIPVGTSFTIAPIALDFGFTTGTTVANSSAVTVPDSTKFTVGQWVILGNVANAAGTASLITQIQSTSGTTTVYVGSNLPATALGIPIGAANLFGGNFLPPATQFGPSAVSAIAAANRLQAGFTRVLNPSEMLARNIWVSIATAANTAVAVLVSGWDAWFTPMTELITLNATTSVTSSFGKKAFKYINSLVPTTTVAQNVYAGIGDTFGFPFRADEWVQVQVYAGGTAVSNSVGITTALLNTAATQTTADVRGTIQVNVNGAGSAISNVMTTNNVNRLAIIQNPGVWNQISCTPNNLAPMFGTAQV